MEQQTPKIKPLSLIITIFGVVIIAALLIKAEKNPVPSAAAPAADQTANSLCYVLNAPASSGTGIDTAYLQMTSADGGQTVTGELGAHLAGTTAVQGTIQGTVTSGADQTTASFDGQFSPAAGAPTDQPIQLDATEATLSLGGNAVSIPSVDCTQYDSLKAAAGF
jgi:hypothetical protein